ncbi:GNAT family N-acetyltransferase [Vibrio sonorensis]|uniref:GNAT family N-acetyltransferase n=1 Tax=Vibrio sonorensis TaxID=1004316 RepID=UPI0008DAA385|nr:GNAT family N-acetyltransferase [Vibrio sonorensis]
MIPVSIKEVSADQTLSIRQKVLWPDKKVDELRLEGDDLALHLGAFSEQTLVCVASFYFDGKTARLRKFAALSAFQNQGIGSQVLQEGLRRLAQKRVELLWCDAREAALPFYQRLGFTLDSERFFKSEVPYFKMKKSLDTNCEDKPID